MILPVSFDEVSYFNNEYRGDLVVTEGVLYYFPHTRVTYSRGAAELKGKETAEYIGLLGLVVPFADAAPWLFAAADKSVKIGKFLKRSFLPSINHARIKDLRIWHGNESSEVLQQKLDAYIRQKKAERLRFDEDSVPQPMRFAAKEMENIRLGFKLRFDAKYDDHDFRVNPLKRGLFKRALREGGFLRK